MKLRKPQIFYAEPVLATADGDPEHHLEELRNQLKTTKTVSEGIREGIRTENPKSSLSSLIARCDNWSEDDLRHVPSVIESIHEYVNKPQGRDDYITTTSSVYEAVNAILIILSVIVFSSSLLIFLFTNMILLSLGGASVGIALFFLSIIPLNRLERKDIVNRLIPDGTMYEQQSLLYNFNKEASLSNGKLWLLFCEEKWWRFATLFSSHVVCHDSRIPIASETRGENVIVAGAALDVTLNGSGIQEGFSSEPARLYMFFGTKTEAFLFPRIDIETLSKKDHRLTDGFYTKFSKVKMESDYEHGCFRFHLEPENDSAQKISQWAGDFHSLLELHVTKTGYGTYSIRCSDVSFEIYDRKDMTQLHRFAKQDT